MPAFDSTSPLVTVGMPTRNRPKTLALALDSIQAQSYRKIEIIVSDNASDDRATADLVRARAAQDERIAFVSQPSLLPMFTHFDSLLRRARGEFFMWAADDDRFAPDFIATCLAALERNGPSCVAATMSAQYETADGAYPFFVEGTSFLSAPIADLEARLARLIDCNFGNLFYSLFRREALFRAGRSAVSRVGQTYNEIPMFLAVAANGDFHLVPEIGFFKAAPLAVIQQAEWEMLGGRLPGYTGIGAQRRELAANLHYHRQVYRECCAALDEIDIAPAVAARSRRRLWIALARHALGLSVGYKRRAAASLTPTRADRAS
jgi:glycosyltransferase involved in cell wall biosynthesis